VPLVLMSAKVGRKRGQIFGLGAGQLEMLARRDLLCAGDWVVRVVTELSRATTTNDVDRSSGPLTTSDEQEETVFLGHGFHQEVRRLWERRQRNHFIVGMKALPREVEVSDSREDVRLRWEELHSEHHATGTKNTIAVSHAAGLFNLLHSLRFIGNLTS